MMVFIESWIPATLLMLMLPLIPRYTLSKVTSLHNQQASFEYDYYEFDQLAQFREITSELATKDFMKTDVYLRRWLKAYEGDLEAAINAFAKSMEWRRKNNIDEILAENLALIDQIIPFSLEGYDKDGRPIFWAPVGTFDLRKIAISGETALYQRYLIKMYELAEDLMFDVGKESGYRNISQIVAILDLAKYNLKQGGCYQSPSIFEILLNFAKGFSKYTKNVMEVFGFDKNQWTTALLQQIPATSLPQEYGGTKPSINSPFSNKNRKDHGFPNFFKYSQQNNSMQEKKGINNVESAKSVDNAEIEGHFVKNTDVLKFSQQEHEKPNTQEVEFNSDQVQAQAKAKAKVTSKLRHHHHYLKSYSRSNNLYSKNSVSYLALNSVVFRFLLLSTLGLIFRSL